MASLAMPTTPKASTTRRDLSFGDAVKGGLAKSAIAQPAVANVVLDESEDHDLDGRSTPVPGSNSSSSRTNTSSSPPSTAPPLTPGDRDGPIQSSVPDTARPFPSAPVGTLVIPQAIHGFGQLAGEEQLKFALQSKDRIFVVMVSNEIEAFIARVLAGEKPMEAQSLPYAVYTQTNLSILGSSVKMQTISTSKFQRMLMYRTAEWYGVKCVTGPEAVMYVGTLGEVAEKSGKLKLPMLVPEREKQQQKFQIMQRRPNSSASTTNGANANSSNNGEGGPTSRKTLEQREAEYAQARERIFQKQGEESAAPADAAERERGREPSRARRGEEDDLGPTASRFPVQRPFEPVYASLYHPQHDNAASVSNNMGQPAYDPNISMMPPQGYYGADGQYGMYPQLPHGGQYADPYAMGGLQMPLPPVPMQVPPNGHQAYTPAQGYDLNGQPILLVSNGMGGYVPWGPQTNMPLQMHGVQGAQGVSGQQGIGVGGVPPPSGGMSMPTMQQPQQWPYGTSTIRAPSNALQQYPGAMNGTQPAPPQSISSHSAFSSPTSMSSFSGYSGAGSVSGPSRQSSSTFGTPQNMNTHLQHPKPQRPQPTHQNSYASSSISSSSRSYQQDYPHSRPHSRGSTTSTVASTRSAGSNVRLGAMYPANAAPGYAGGVGHGQYPGGGVYAQNGLNGQYQSQQPHQQQTGGRGKHMVREVNGLTSLNIGRERRGRGQSPSGSTTTTSSRSSRRTNAHAAQAATGPTQPYHPLPQRPDWSTASASAAPSVSGSSVSGTGQANAQADATSAAAASLADSTSPTSLSIGSTIPPSSPAQSAQSELASVSVDGQVDVLSEAGAGVEDGQPAHAVVGQGEAVVTPEVEIRTIPDITIDVQAQASTSAPPSAIKAPVARPEDPDFPARGPATSNQTLYNPKPAPNKVGPGSLASAQAPRAPAIARNGNVVNPATGANGASLPAASTPRLATAPAAPIAIPALTVDETGMSAEDVIEAKLRAISVTTGVNIGPKPARVSGSYAKAVRRD